MTPADQIYSLPTAVGTAKMTYGQANNLPVQISHMAIGDGNGAIVSPGAGALALVHEVYRAQLNQLYQHETNPNWLVAELVIPAEVGGWTIRELGLYDTAGDLIYVGNHAEQYKPVQSQGSDETKTIRMVILTSSTSAVTLKTDPTVVMASIDYVDRSIAKLDHKQSVRYTTTAPIGLAGLAVQAGGDWTAALTTGDRVLVKNQAAGKDNGIYAAAAGAWLRVADADGSPEVTSGLVVAIEQGATLADTRWQLVTDGAIVLGTTALVFQNVTQGFAPLAALGNFQDQISKNTSSVLLASEAGAVINLIAGALNTTLPLLSSVPKGASFTFICTGQNGASILRNGADTMSANGVAQVSYALSIGDTLTLVSAGTLWLAVSGTARDKFQPGLASTLLPNGVKRIPDASSPTGFFIIQWGVATSNGSGVGSVVLPIAFPNSHFRTFLTPRNSAPYNASASVNLQTVSGFAFYTTNASGGSVGAATAMGIEWFAIGY